MLSPSTSRTQRHEASKGASRARIPLVAGLLVTAALVAGVPVGVAPAGSSVEFINYAGPAWTESSGEPTLGVNWNTSNVMMMTGGYPLLNVPPSQHVTRILFNDSVSPATATWTDVTPPFMTTNVDPILNVDSHKGRTFAGGDDGACTILFRTDDDGDNWTPVGNSCPAAADHPTVGQGPPSALAPVQPVGALYEDVVYVCQQASVNVCAVSNDGGNTFAPSAPVGCVFANPGLSGHLRVGPDGWAYLPFNQCATGLQGVSVSSTDGQPTSGTAGWIGRPVPTATTGAGGASSDPSIAIGRGDNSTGGRLYFAANNGSTHHAVVATSTNHGLTWSAAVDLNVASARHSGAAENVTHVVFPTAIAGDDNRSAVAFLGTKNGTAGSTAPYASTAFTGEWHLYVAFTLTGGANWTSYDLTPTDPVQRGMICLAGTTCASGRNLLDFMDIVTDARGRVLIGYADGCLGCATVAQSTHALATIARQSCGPSLFEAIGTVEGSDPCPTQSNPPPPVLSGTLYFTGVLPEGTADSLVAGDTLTGVAPNGPASKVVSNAASLHGSNAGAIYDAHFFKNGPATLSGNVTVRFWATTTGNVTTGGAIPVRVELYDAGSATFALPATVLASQTVALPPTATPTLFTATFTNLGFALANGFEVFIDTGPGAVGEVDVWYDAAATPSQVVFS